MTTLPPQPPPKAELLRHTFELACSAYDQGHLQEAKQRYLFLLDYYPASSLLHYDLGLVYLEQTEYDLALNQFSLAAKLSPGDVDTLFNLALCQKHTGDRAAAIITYGRILDLESDHVDSLYNLGGCHRDQYDDDQAIACYQRVLQLKPTYLPAISNLASLHHRGGCHGLAACYYAQVLEQQPDNESVRYLLAALLGKHLDHSPDGYIRDFFNSYAAEFEHSLVVELGYDNPRQLFDCLGHSEAGNVRYAHGLDLGCGTGLSGMAFRGVVATLDGVDLSDRMLAQAAEKECYAHLYQDSILHYLASTGESYDFFLATDVFIYVGDLTPVFHLGGGVARAGALFCFSTERLEEAGYRLLPTGRFAYSTGYVRKTAEEAGWSVLLQEAVPLRRERDQWLDGDVWILRWLGD